MRERLRRIKQGVRTSGAQSSLRLMVALFFTLLVTVIVGGIIDQSSQSFISNPNEQVIPASEFFKVFPGKKKTASMIDLGLYIDSIYDLDLSRLTFKARGWLWYNWTKTPMIESKVDPGQMGRFDLNFLDEIDVNQEISSQEPVVDHGSAGNSSYWNETSFDAKLAAPSINLRNYPFDRQQLYILVTNPVHETGEVIYKIQQFRLPPRVFNISGYKLDGISYSDEIRIYTSNFADASNVSWRDDTATTQSQAAFKISISRNPLTSLLEYVMPLAIVSFLAVSVVRLAVCYWEVKLTAPPAAILSLIFLQNTFQQDLPRVSYMTCMDLMFLIGYLVCLLSFADALLSCLFVDSERYRGLYGKFACIVLALSPLMVRGWLSLPT
jgi:hypothetical protein